MKRCPECRRDYADDTLLYCLEDGAALIQGSVPSPDEPATAILSDPSVSAAGQIDDATTRAFTNTAAAEPQSQVGEPSEKQSFSANRAAKPVFAAVAAGILLVGGFLGYRFFNSAESSAVNSIAVLPFENRSGSGDTDYLSDGLADSLIYRLSQLPDLKVSPTSSVMRYKGMAGDVAKVASELGVDAVMTGRLSQTGDNLNISVQLIDVKAQKVIWAEQYDRKMSDLLATQRQIATTISDKLKLKLAGTAGPGIKKRYTENNEAYQEYLRGRHHWNKRTKDGIEQSILNFEKAIDLDPTFALAHVGIANAYNVMPPYAYMSPKEATPRAFAAAKRALEIDPELGEAHSAYATVAGYEHRWTEVERGTKRAVELDPNSPQSHYRYAIEYLAPVGRIDEAVVAINRALELEPLSMPIGANLAGMYIYARKYDLALEHALKVNALEPGHATASIWLGRAYVVSGRYQEAVELCEKLLSSQPDNQDLLQILGFAQAKAGRPAETQRIIAKFAEMEKKQYVVLYRIATLYAVLGNKDRAFAEMERSYEARDWDFKRLKVDPFVDSLREDPRFVDLLRKLNLPE